MDHPKAQKGGRLMQGLKDKRIVIAGGATGIGAATAKRLAAEGAKVIVGDFNVEGAKATTNAITTAGGTAEAIAFDLADEESCQALIQACIDKFGGIDGLANVGADLSLEQHGGDVDLLHMSEKIWKRAWDINLMGYTRTVRAALPHLIAQRSGSIVCVSSGGAHVGRFVAPAYATSKLALHALIRHIAWQWGSDNIRCNAVAPGPVATETSVRNMPQVDPEGMQRMLNSMALGRAGRSEEAAAPIAFLLSDDASWITGQVISVNGGWTMRD